MKEGWTYKKLGDECSILYGYPFDSKCFSTSPDDMPLIRIRDVKEGKTSTFYNGDYPKDYIIHKGDYLIGMDGEFNISPWQSEDALLNQRVCKISCNTSSLLIRYVYRFLIKELKKIEDETPFVTVKHLSAKKINQINIPVPPIAEQERIVAELDLLQGIIEKKKEQLKAYDQLAKSIFYTMFGDIEEDTPVSEYISALSGGKSLAGETECKNKVLKTGAVTYDYFRDNEVKNLPADYQPIKEHLLNDGDILISRMNTLEYVGACAYVWKAPLNTYLPDRLWRATLKDNINPIFLWFSLIQDKAKEQIRSMASGTSGSMKNISIPRFLTVKIKCIPLSLQQEFAEKVEAIERQKALVQQSIEETQTMFDYTMDKYFG